MTPLLTGWAWWYPLLGGALIGTSAGVYLLMTGRVAGISGMAANAVGLEASGSRSLSATFLVGLVLAAALASSLLRSPAIEITTDWPALVLGGLLVGFGTRLGSGCTSGHGICGMARLSRRSIAATCVFMLSAMLTVYVTHHMIGLPA